MLQVVTVYVVTVIIDASRSISKSDRSDGAELVSKVGKIAKKKFWVFNAGRALAKEFKVFFY